MDKREYRAKLDALRDDPNLIPGIYNYCDRWCERCPFTKRCMTYAMQQNEDALDDSIDNDKFWNRLHVTFEATLEMIAEQAEELGIDVTEPDPEVVKEEKRVHRRARLHPLSKQARHYGETADAWLEGGATVLEDIAAELVQADRLELPGRNPAEEAELLKDALEVIRWYQYFIEAKLYRALSGLGRHEDDDEYEAYDANGSAKLALIAIDRSIAAWGLLLKHCPGQEDGLLPILASLEKARRLGEKTFPDARAFHRPGFDD